MWLSDRPTDCVVIGRAREGTSRRGAFTLVELLIVVAIVMILMSMLLPALRSVRDQAKSLHCASNLRNISMEFQLFAAGQSAAGQGDSEKLGSERFRINDFVDSVYKLDEFWDAGDEQMVELSASRDVALCPAGVRNITKRKGLPCGRDSLSPVDGISLGFNMRLYRGLMEVEGMTLLAPVNLTKVRSSILSHPYVPLVVDVDATAASSAGLDPFYVAPDLDDSSDPYDGDRFWFPSNRHKRSTNVAFVGGHVLSSSHPATERWNWGYAASVGN